jgi:hypothetical protein
VECQQRCVPLGMPATPRGRHDSIQIRSIQYWDAWAPRTGCTSNSDARGVPALCAKGREQCVKRGQIRRWFTTDQGPGETNKTLDGNESCPCR